MRADPRTDTPPARAELATMAAMRANGATMRNIGLEIGVDPSTVCRRLQSSEAKEIIERESARLLAALPDITASSIQQISTANRIHAAIAGQKDEEGNSVTLPAMLSKIDKDGNHDPSNAIAYAAMASKRESDILKAMGILASPVQSIVIQQVYNDNRQAILSPDILKALSGTTTPQDDIEDAEIIGGDTDLTT